jgi:hypothetical protein
VVPTRELHLGKDTLDDILPRYTAAHHVHIKTAPLLLLLVRQCETAHRLKLVIGVETSTRLERRAGNAVCVCRNRRRRKAERKSMCRRVDDVAFCDIGIRWLVGRSEFGRSTRGND